MHVGHQPYIVHHETVQSHADFLEFAVTNPSHDALNTAIIKIRLNIKTCAHNSTICKPEIRN